MDSPGLDSLTLARQTSSSILEQNIPSRFLPRDGAKINQGLIRFKLPVFREITSRSCRYYVSYYEVIIPERDDPIQCALERRRCFGYHRR